MEWIKLGYAVLRASYEMAREAKQSNKTIERLNSDNWDERIERFIDSALDDLFVTDSKLTKLQQELEKARQEISRLTRMIEESTIKFGL